MDPDNWIPLVLFFFIFAGVWVVSYYLHVAKIKRFDTIIKLAESGGEVKPEMLAMLGKDESKGGPTSDLRKGLIWIAIGVPICLAFLSQNELVGTSLGLAPILIGIAYLVVMKLGYKDLSDR